MPRDRGRNDERSRLAHLAARIMAEDGIEDYGMAKRKAARQAGIPDTRQLPTNEEIEAARRSYQALYQPDAAGNLRELREAALRAMRALDAFTPFLTGSVLTGSAGRYAAVSLHLYADDPKAVERFLIDKGIEYRASQRMLHVGREMRVVPVYLIEDRGIEVELILLAAGDLRGPVRTTAEGKPLERARREAVEALLAVDS